MASESEASAIKECKILMVGAGGIGCELLKTLVMTGFTNIHLIDLDTIDVSNLNRQFLFRKSHVGKSKAKIAREAALKIRPSATIVAHHGNVKDAEFGVDFVSGFSIVLSGLDNVDARRHVNRICLAANVPLIESGTTGYNGQVDVHLKGETECYECRPKAAPKSYPTCTITNTPSKPIHCIVWAKELPFQKLFGDKSQANDLDLRTEDSLAADEERRFFEPSPGQPLLDFARQLFDRLFGSNIANTLTMAELWKSRRKPTPLYLADVLSEGQEEPRSSRREGDVSAMAALGLTDPQRVWTVQENAQVFLQAVKLLFEHRKEDIGRLSFDKDDTLAVEFVTSAANLRSHSFGIPLQSLFEAKGMAGNIVHAIATTNAIVAGLIVLQTIKVVTGRQQDCRVVWCNEHPMGRGYLVMPMDPNPPNSKCYVCSQSPLLLEVNTKSTTLGQLVEKVLVKSLSIGSPIILHANDLLYETGDDLEPGEVARYENNLKKVLCEFPTPIVNGSILSIEDYQQEFKCSLHIKHRDHFDEEESDRMLLRGDIPVAGDGAEEEGKDEGNGPVGGGEDSIVVGEKRKVAGDEYEESRSKSKVAKIALADVEELQ